MKSLFLLLFTLSAHAFMTPDQIFETRSQKALPSSTLSKEDKIREASLIPAKDFFGQRAYKKPKYDFKGSGQADLRNRDTKVKTQDDSKCTAFAGVAVMENLLNKNINDQNRDLSEWDAWSKYKRYSCEAFVGALSKSYICEEKDYPQGYKKKQSCIGKYGHIVVQDITEDYGKVLETLDNGYPVYTGMSVPTDMTKCKSVIATTSRISNGGHALAVVGYFKKEGIVYLILKNSWGDKCGDKGYQYFPLELCNNSKMYCLFWSIVNIGVRQ